MFPSSLSNVPRSLCGSKATCKVRLGEVTPQQPERNKISLGALIDLNKSTRCWRGKAW